MYFKDEYELEMNNQIFYVEVEGECTGEDEYNINNIQISDSFGQEVDDTHSCYDDIISDAQEREYIVEEDNRNFDEYDSDFDNFLRESSW